MCPEYRDPAYRVKHGVDDRRVRIGDLGMERQDVVVVLGSDRPIESSIENEVAHFKIQRAGQEDVGTSRAGLHRNIMEIFSASISAVEKRRFIFAIRR